MMRAVLSCRESAGLASKAQDGRLGLIDRVALRLHLMMCSGCRAYTRQIRSLATLLDKRAQQNHGILSTQGGLSPDARARIRAVLHESTRD